MGKFYLHLMEFSSMDCHLIKQFWILNQVNSQPRCIHFHFVTRFGFLTKTKIFPNFCVAGVTYRLRISNVGLRTSLNFRIYDHMLLLVETEGSYTVKQYLDSLDIHVGQSYSALVTAKNVSGESYYMVASSRFTDFELFGIGIIRYPDSAGVPDGPLPVGPFFRDYQFCVDQARSIRYISPGLITQRE